MHINYFSQFSYLGSTHNCWHLAISLLEKQSQNIKLANDSALINPNNQPVEKLVKKLLFILKLDVF